MQGLSSVIVLEQCPKRPRSAHGGRESLACKPADHHPLSECSWTYSRGHTKLLWGAQCRSYIIIEKSSLQHDEAGMEILPVGRPELLGDPNRSVLGIWGGGVSTSGSYRMSLPAAREETLLARTYRKPLLQNSLLDPRQPAASAETAARADRQVGHPPLPVTIGRLAVEQPLQHLGTVKANENIGRRLVGVSIIP